MRLCENRSELCAFERVGGLAARASCGGKRFLRGRLLDGDFGIRFFRLSDNFVGFLNGLGGGGRHGITDGVDSLSSGGHSFGDSFKVTGFQSALQSADRIKGLTVNFRDTLTRPLGSQTLQTAPQHPSEVSWLYPYGPR